MADDDYPLSGMLASAVVKVARDRLVAALDFLAAATMPDDDEKKKLMGRHMEELKQKMEAMAEVVDDAEKLSLESTTRRLSLEVREWLIRAEDAAYGIWDMVDELQIQANNQWKPPVTEVVHLPWLTARKGRSIASRMLKAKENLDELLQSGLRIMSPHLRDIIPDIGKLPQLFVADSSEEDHYVFVGRDWETRHMTRTILSAEKDTSSSGLVFLPILGMAGIGKTSFAEMVFTQDVLGDYARAWVTVGDRFDLKRIGNCILSQLLLSDTANKNEGEHHHRHCHCQDYDSSGGVDVESVTKRLRYELLGAGGGGGNGNNNKKKLLLVLDDLRSDDSSDLEGLSRMLGCSGAGKDDDQGSSMVIAMVTTRLESVATTLAGVITTDQHVYKLDPLDDEDSFNLLQHKLGFGTRHDRALHQIQMLRGIATNCRGVPLAIHAIGPTLRSKSAKEIITVLMSDLWKCEHYYSVSTPVLLSYQCMPLNLRLCFASCAIFPRGHSIPKDDLIHHWTALQLIEPSSDTLSTTQLANKYISKLLDMSFLQRAMVHPSSALLKNLFKKTLGKEIFVNAAGLPSVKKKLDKELFVECFILTFGKNHRYAVSLTMHDLVYDLATQLSSKTLIVLDSTNSYQHSIGQKNSYRRAWLTNSDISPANLSYVLSAQLEVLLFHGCSDRQLSDDSFLSAKCLRFLDLRDCRLQKVPDSIFQLKQLRYLNMSGSTRLVDLPDAFGNLINLGHIDLSGCSGLSKLPESFVLLEKLEYLDLSSCSCLEGIPRVVDALTSLQHLNLSHPCCYIAQHRFHLRGLKDVWVKLTNLRYLNLSMCLNPIFSYLPEQERIEYIESISCLHTLEHLDLSHNIFLCNLPESLGQLSQLQTLNLSGCARLNRIEKWIGDKKLIGVSNCLGLETYQFVVRIDRGPKSGSLSQLKDVSCKELEISCLEKVVSTEEAQNICLMEKKLQKLTLVWSPDHDDASFKNDETLLVNLVPPKNLRCFELHGYRSQCLPTWLSTSSISSHLPNIVEVSMVDIPSCDILPPFGALSTLQRLILRRVSKVTRVEAGSLSGRRLLHVTLDGMGNLEEFRNSSGSDELVINSCPKLRFRNSPPKAQMLVISDCNHLMLSPMEAPSSSTSPAITCGPVTEVVIESCKVPLDELNWSLLQGLAPLHSLHISNCSEKIISPEIMKGHLSSLKLLCFSHCDSMTNIPEHVVLVQDTSLQELVIHECLGIKSLPQSICDEKKKHYPLVRIRQCPELRKWCGELEDNKRKFAQKHIIFEGESSSNEAETSAKSMSD